MTSGTVAWVLGPLTWRTANKYLSGVRAGRNPPQGQWLVIAGKYLSIASILFSVIALIALIIAIANQ